MNANDPLRGPYAMRVVAVCKDETACGTRLIEQSLKLAPPTKPEPEVEARAA